MERSELEERLAFALTLAEEAGAITLEHFLTPDLEVEVKVDGSPVTVADRRAERHLRERIEATWPDDGVLGEEEGNRPGSNGARWILDPIDGTESFRRGVPLYGTLIGLEVGGEAVVGVVSCPAVGETVAAARGLGARWWVRGEDEPRPARVSNTPELGRALFAVTSSMGFAEAGFPGLHGDLLGAADKMRGWSDCYGHLLVATGRADAMIDPVMNVWDNAPMLPILEEAGGRFTDLDGHRRIDGGSALSTNGHLHGPVLTLAAAARARASA